MNAPTGNSALAASAGSAGLFEAAKRADWIQVALNAIGTGAAPCFHLENGRFCLRADRWAGHEEVHAKGPGHHFVSLEALLRSMSPNAPGSARFAATADGTWLLTIDNGDMKISVDIGETDVGVVVKHGAREDLFDFEYPPNAQCARPAEGGSA